MTWTYYTDWRWVWAFGFVYIFRIRAGTLWSEGSQHRGLTLNEPAKPCCVATVLLPRDLTGLDAHFLDTVADQKGGLFFKAHH